MSVRVRFAPSPTGPLHIGGVRTALYNYLFARKHNGDFILRIEDTDQGRYVPGAQAYIEESLNWLNIAPDESPQKDGGYGPYRQSERLDLYEKYARILIENGSAYYAFDTTEELEAMRASKEAEGMHSPKYDHSTRMEMTNSLTLSEAEVAERMNSGDAYTIRLKIEPGKEIAFSDEVRGEVSFRSEELDDKILMKSDGWPTYHLANVVDDHLMAITHVIRGEEWLSSTPHHVYLYKAFGWEDEMPNFVHLPLILKPTGKGKLSKRDGAKFGFPVFPLDWKGDEPFEGFREKGFLPEAVVNFLALLGWHPSDEQELFELNELIEAFELDRISKSGARFDYEKAKWFNQQYLVRKNANEVVDLIKAQSQTLYGQVEEDKLKAIVLQMAPRVEFIHQILEDGRFFFEVTEEIDEKTVRKRFKEDSEIHLRAIVEKLNQTETFDAATVEETVKSYMQSHELGFGAIFPLLRIALSGTLKGPDLFAIFEILGREESCTRMIAAIQRFKGIAS